MTPKTYRIYPLIKLRVETPTPKKRLRSEHGVIHGWNGARDEAGRRIAYCGRTVPFTEVSSKTVLTCGQCRMVLDANPLNRL